MQEPLRHALEGEKSVCATARRLIAEGYDASRQVIWTRAGKPAFAGNEFTLGDWAAHMAIEDNSGSVRVVKYAPPPGKRAAID